MYIEKLKRNYDEDFDKFISKCMSDFSREIFHIRERNCTRRSSR